MNHYAYGSDGGKSCVSYHDPYAMKCIIRLKNEKLWQQFHSLDNEMIITKTGRRMFPSLQVEVSDLECQSIYCVMVEMIPVSRCRFKYSTSGGWAPAGSEEVQSPNRLYIHPESPAKGEYWMSQPVSFARMKLTNTPTAPPGQVVLTSMHKYQPRIIIAKTSEPAAFAWSPNSCVAFPETQFVAVTAYQNEKITQLKIDNNPFAKGFRETGQSKCKRKRDSSSESDNEETKVQKIDVEAVSPPPPAPPGESSPCPSPEIVNVSKESRSGTAQLKELYHYPPYSYDSFYASPSAFYPPASYYPPPAPFYPGYPNYYGSFFWKTPQLPCDPIQGDQTHKERVNVRDEERNTRKYSDFSIKALLGY